MSRPKDIPEDVWEKAGTIINGAGNWRVDLSRLILSERERCANVANERAAQLFAGIKNFGMSDETKAGWAGQMMEALMIEQRISDGHKSVDSIDTSMLKSMANQPGES